ncbi:MAG: MarR family transcriptional regulator [Clostridiales bacterium]|nr:MarR family transcriptional regulator [Clostridiales bacterium]
MITLPDNAPQSLGNGLLLKRIEESLKKRADQNLCTIDLTTAQSHILRVLGFQEGETCTLKDLERFFHLAQSTVAGTVSRLEKKGLVEALPDESDRRVKVVRLTELGRERNRLSWEMIQNTERQMLVGMTEEEQQELNRLLRMVYENIR